MLIRNVSASELRIIREYDSSSQQIMQIIQALDEQVDTQEKELDDLRSELSDRDDEIIELKLENQQLTSDLCKANQELFDLAEETKHNKIDRDLAD